MQAKQEKKQRIHTYHLSVRPSAPREVEAWLARRESWETGLPLPVALPDAQGEMKEAPYDTTREVER
jgi:hypothetical protein